MLRLLLIITIATVACGPTEKNLHAGVDTSTAASKPTPPPSTQPSFTCYQYASNGDTMLLKLKRSGNSATGSFDQVLKEKDANRGSFTGTLYGDTLVAAYEFSSEGSTSVRDIAFLLRQESVLPGFGEMQPDSAGNLRFTNKNKLQFQEQFVMKQLACN